MRPPPDPATIRNVLVIKLSALGDFIQALAPMKAIRDHHKDARITVLTTPPFAPLARACPFVDAVETGGRPRSLSAWWTLVRTVRAGKFDIVYDLQTNDRTALLFQLLRPFPPLWSGVAWGCSYPHKNPRRMLMHTVDRQAEQLVAAGIGPPEGYLVGAAPTPDLTWLRAGLGHAPELEPEHFGLTGPYAALVPGSSPQHLEKRWPAEKFAELAKRLLAIELTPVILGSTIEAPVAAAIKALVPEVVDLAGKTDLFQVMALAEKASVAIGNDTGPMHAAGAAGAPSVVLFSRKSDPNRAAPRGRNVVVLRSPDLADLAVDDVVRAALAVAHLGPALDPVELSVPKFARRGE